MIFDSRLCELGEGALWHPIRRQLFWFDILGKRLHTVEEGEPRHWSFVELVSAAGWLSRDHLLIAGERDLFLFDLETEDIETLAELEADKPGNRSNDGRADRQGGFWIGTMSKRGEAEPGAGAIYRWYRGELRLLFPGLTIPNSICFSPDGRTAYFADTVTQVIQKVALDAAGWPCAAPEVFVDLSAEGLFPDGSTIDAEGNLWNAQWGAGRVACYSPQGRFLRAVPLDAPHTTCPAFGSEGLATLFCTSALEGLDAAARAAHPLSGTTFAVQGVARGLPEPRVEIGMVDGVAR
ncbi:SMP-30/gluconolactonase/LRE family protein [Tabrizicola oligotrophica]|uniref:SMP-30/gluconolactonase/LRE family protein n=1 Tax=Tabrizicola oligotrophica TaxID=2710650 RepID=A0A6M0QQA8_9RHOB|nr:SMP-30/gluconolactonase/LRE family protein [Tabrizicola oligotrophica]NEY89536.1 SMP-30/gluconolactonase/LRE family protein [Tabrizicola oligotrophica]